MTKQIILTVTCLLLFATTFAQKTKKDSLLSTIANDLCTEITANKLTAKSKEDFETQLGLTMMPMFVKYEEQLKEFFDVDMTNQKSMEDIGLQIGMSLATKCPYFLTMMKDNSSAFIGSGKTSDIKVSVGGSLTGTLIKIVPGDFTYFTIKNETGKIEKIWWQEYFKGSEKITNANLNKTLKVTFVEKDIYNSTLKDYIKQKIAVAIE